MRLVVAWLVVVWPVVALPALALAQVPGSAPLVRMSLDPADGIVIGQPVRLLVEVMFAGDMPHPPLVKLRDAPGAQILRFETQAVTIRDHVNGQDYVGQSFEFLVFPRRGGEIAIPPPDITLLDRKGDPAGSVAGDATTIAVTVPPGLDASGPVLVADKVTVSESWSPDPASASFKAGGAITRTLRRQANGVPALGMAEFRFAAPEGVRVYVDPPVIDDRANRGVVEGVRTDKATYVFERPGRYALPELSQPWWDMANKQARTEALPGLTIAVAAGAAGATSATTTSSLRWQSPLIAIGFGTILLLALPAIFWHPLRAGLDRFLQRRRSSEAFARKALQRAAASGDPTETYHALSVWFDRLPPTDANRIRVDPRLQPLIDKLDRALFGTGAGWSGQHGAELSEAIAAAHRGGPMAPTRPDPLPPLNPAFPR
ncbi:hypothetical protein LJR009_000005 [Bosea sp. LjRoot9]|uniref:BatD family protein n=1 Tax=Bosea sp. LjRoot9 TaxID=3342341 RepID=UPI003ECFCC76